MTASISKLCPDTRRIYRAKGLPIFAVVKTFIGGVLDGLTIIEETTADLTAFEGLVVKAAAGGDYLVESCMPVLD